MHIKKIVVDDVEYLPHITDTPLMSKWENGALVDKQRAALYNALVDRENYFQDHSVVAFGNLDFARYEGVVQGICIALELDENNTDDTIVFRKNGRKFLEIDRVKRPECYFEDKRELRELMNSL